MCKKTKATLVVAYLDRLSADVAEMATIQNSVKFVVVDLPYASRFEIQIYTALAEEHRRRISEDTKAALHEAKLRGIKLGTNGKKLSQTNQNKRETLISKMKPIIQALAADGITTLRGIAYELNQRNIPSFREGTTRWHSASVFKLLQKIRGK